MAIAAWTPRALSSSSSFFEKAWTFLLCTLIVPICCPLLCTGATRSERVEPRAARAPAEPARRDPGDDALDAVLPHQRLVPACEQRVQRLVDGAEAEEANVDDARGHGAGGADYRR